MRSRCSKRPLSIRVRCDPCLKARTGCACFNDTQGMKMNDLAKNLLLWVVVAVVLMVVFQAFGPRSGPTETLAYDQFIQQVQSDRVQSVVINDDKTTISGKRKDSTEFVTYAPEDQGMMYDLMHHNVSITQRPPQSGPPFWT